MPLPDHLFTASDNGALYDTRAPDWSRGRPVRANYRGQPARIETLADVKAALRAGDVAWPGGYPLYFVTRDGAALSFAAVRQQFASVADDFLSDSSSGWRVAAILINHEDPDLTCDHTGARIPSAYGDDDASDEEAA